MAEYDPTWCPSATADVLPQVQALLPQGPAWKAASVPGSVQNEFWSGVAASIAWVNSRLCAYIPEFFCTTAVESLDQWQAEYGLTTEECDPYGANLCYKVFDPGGQDCAHFVDMAAHLGWVITCDDSVPDLPMAGCFDCGCVQLGTTPEVIEPGSNAGVGQLCACGYGRAVEHPEPNLWRFGSGQALASCPVPGSNLGCAPLSDSDCNFAGYYDWPDAGTVSTPAGICASADQNRWTWDVPSPAGIPLDRVPCDSTGEFKAYTGDALIWRVTIHLDASTNARAALVEDASDWSVSGGLSAGCGQLNGTDFRGLTCFLDQVKPAHTQLIYEVA